MSRKNHLEQFHKDLNGNYIYEGEHYVLAPADSFPILRRKLLALGGGMLVCTVLCGCVGAAGMQGCFYVLLPYAGELLSAISLCWALGSLAGCGGRLRDYLYKKTVPAAAKRAKLTAAFAAVCIVGEWIFLLLEGAGGRVAGTVAFQGLHLAGIALGFLLCRTIKASCWEKEARRT